MESQNYDCSRTIEDLLSFFENKMLFIEILIKEWLLKLRESLMKFSTMIAVLLTIASVAF
jgi:hypothetical protein